jgi:hypothetical protein
MLRSAAANWRIVGAWFQVAGIEGDEADARPGRAGHSARLKG